ncbi:MAG TPA: isochorismatase family protein [Acidobacteriaceae bacterium]
MASFPIRDQGKDELLTPTNAALIIIDYQPVQVQSIASMDRQRLINNIAGIAKAALVYQLPIVLSMVNVKTGLSEETIPQLRLALPRMPSYDRIRINTWEDKEFADAVKATGRKKLLMTALWSEAYLPFPSFDAMGEGYEVYPVVDCVAGASLEAHKTALDRLIPKRAQPVSWAQIFCELQRDRATKEMAGKFKHVLIGTVGMTGIRIQVIQTAKLSKRAKIA